LAFRRGGRGRSFVWPGESGWHKVKGASRREWCAHKEEEHVTGPADPAALGGMEVHNSLTQSLQRDS
jgi:hypothetical protein